MRSRGATLSNCSNAILDSDGQFLWNLDSSATGLLSYARENVNVKAGAYVMLAVSDTGIGMTEGIRSRVFEPFFTTKEQGKGTGLGLSTVYGIIKQSGGHIAVYSEPGIGSTFKVYLPEVNKPAEARAPSPQAISMSGRNETILVVEDEDGVRALVQHILQKHGYKTLVASGGDEALEIGNKHKESIDLLLTDVVLTHMSGREVAERLAVSRPGMKVLFMSGYTDDAILHHGILEAHTAFLQKPFTTDSLARKVREVLEAAATEGHNANKAKA